MSVMTSTSTSTRRNDRPNDALAHYHLPMPTASPKTLSCLALYALGLYIAFAAPPLTHLSDQKEAEYHAKMASAVYSPSMLAARDALIAAESELHAVHVFGWRWRPPYDGLVPRAQQRLARARADYDAESRERDALVGEAKSAVGIFSRFGVEEARAAFWADYEWGKAFAKRMTWWDVVFASTRGRDEELYVTLLRALGQLLMNFTVGLLAAWVSFVFTLLQLIWAYKASYAAGLFFFAVAMTGASAVVGSFIVGMYATAVGGVYLVARQANTARLQGGQARRVRARPEQGVHVD